MMMQAGSSSTHRRKTVTKNAGGGSVDVSPATTKNSIVTPNNNNSNNNHHHHNVPIATVKRRTCGTSPFDKYWLNLDCCGLFCAGLTYGLHLYGMYAVCCLLLPPWMSVTTAAAAAEKEGDGGAVVRHMTMAGLFHQCTFVLMALLAMVSHFKAMTTDPGAVPPDARPLEDEEEGVEKQQDESNEKNNAKEENVTDRLLQQASTKKKRLCRRCHAYKPQRSFVCRRCIIKMDHHCPWVNNCVGIGNHKYFLLFCFYTFVTCLYSMTLVVARFVLCMQQHHPHGRRHHDDSMTSMHCFDQPTHLLNILGLVIEALLFGMFTSCMMMDQWEVVWSNMTHIDRLKGGVGGDAISSSSSSDNKNPLAGVLEVFGTGRYASTITATKHHFRPDWLSPFAAVCFPSQRMQDAVLGYCRPPCRNRNTATSRQDSDLELGACVTITASSSGNSSSSSGRMVRSVAEIV